MKNFLGVFGSSGANAITDKDQKNTKKRPVTMEIKFDHEIERGLN